MKRRPRNKTKSGKTIQRPPETRGRTVKVNRRADDSCTTKNPKPRRL